MKNSLSVIKNIINTKDITILFQPIISLKTGEILGYEALSRGPENSDLYYPDKLFNAASFCNKYLEVDSLCRNKTLQKLNQLKKDKLLFININPTILNNQKFKEDFTINYLFKSTFSPSSIVFELSEKTEIENYDKFNTSLSFYQNKGYQIALDDTGSGYSGLKTLSKIKTNYIKIDIALIKNIHKDKFKQYLVKFLVKYAKKLNIKVIAEGIECEKELSQLIYLDVDYAQGYFIQKPSKKISNISPNIKNIILKHKKLNPKTNAIRRTTNKYDYFNKFIGEICDFEKSFTANISCKDMQKYINTCKFNGVCIVENNNFPIGLITKQSLNSVLAVQYGFSVFSRRPVSLIMDCNALIVDYYTPVNKVSKLAMNREDSKVYDCIIVTKNSKYLGLVTVKKLLEFTTTIKTNYAKQLNPLTGLPGNIIIDNMLKGIIRDTHTFCILYLDLDNFKAYNDVYGFENGDRILNFTSNLIENKLKNKFPYDNFIGHIGGDDFICIIKSSFQDSKELCDSILNEFDIGILNFFNKEDIKRGYIESLDRTEKKTSFNLTTLSIAGVYGNFNSFSNTEEITKLATEIKSKAKKIKGSSVLIHNL
ncbi:EAL domain-containing protein [Clostridium oceanicum]|uniref:EAL domain-containing protein n=1 Tax=Clostridium oceanicum TaxID=1543 RepID=A0ABN1J9W2_9CLOT